MISWGIIGCGNVTEVKSGPAFNKVGGSRLVAVMRRNLDLAKDYARRHNVPRYYDNASQLIADPEVNAVYVATPPSSHAEYALMAINAGKPVYVEKPMAVSFAECQRINEAASVKNIPVFVAYYRRALPGFLKVKELIGHGTIGKVRHINMQLFKSPSDAEKAGNPSWHVKPEISGAGHFFDLASHQLDYLDFLFGPVQSVKSLALNQAGLYEVEDFVSAELLFDDKITVVGTWCFALSPASDRDVIEIFGDKGSIRFSCFTFEPIILTNDCGVHEFKNERPEHVQFNLIQQVVRDLEGTGISVSNGLSGARTCKVMDEIVKAYYKDKRQKQKDKRR